MESTEKAINLRVKLSGKNFQSFSKIKNTMGFKTNTEVVRYCINQTAKESNFKLHDDFVSSINRYLERRDVRNKYSIYTVNDFIKKSLKQFMEHIDKNTSSIKSWNVRSHLPESQIKLALLFLEIQNEKISEEVTHGELLSRSDMRDEKAVISLLEDWYENGIISRRRRGNEWVYHAK